MDLKDTKVVKHLSNKKTIKKCLTLHCKQRLCLQCQVLQIKSATQKVPFPETELKFPVIIYSESLTLKNHFTKQCSP